MSIDYAKLVPQGRAKAHGQPWEPEELEAVITLERERKLDRRDAADYVRNGIMSVEDFDKAQKAKFKPKTQKEAVKDMQKSLKERGEKVVKKVSSNKKKK